LLIAQLAASQPRAPRRSRLASRPAPGIPTPPWWRRLRPPCPPSCRAVTGRIQQRRASRTAVLS